MYIYKNNYVENTHSGMGYRWLIHITTYHSWDLRKIFWGPWCRSFHRWSLRRGDAPRGTTLLSASLLFATLLGAGWRVLGNFAP